jgi:hypothetical protein
MKAMIYNLNFLKNLLLPFASANILLVTCLWNFVIPRTTGDFASYVQHRSQDKIKLNNK